MKLQNLISTILLILVAVGVGSAVAEGAEVNRRKFGGKELMSDHGLNLYDFAARHQNPAYPHFTTPDPLAEKFKHLSPHLFCAGDPINLIDPTGMVIDSTQMSQADLVMWQNEVKLLSSQCPVFKTLLEKLNSSDKVYTIKIVERIDNESTKDQKGRFIQFGDESGGEIIFTYATFNELGNAKDTMIEELFHAFQSEMDYPENCFNIEFEAVLFYDLALQCSDLLKQTHVFPGYNLLTNEINRIESLENNNSNKAAINRFIHSLQFKVSYMIAANSYAIHNILIGTKSAPYKVFNLCLPRALYEFF